MPRNVCSRKKQIDRPILVCAQRTSRTPRQDRLPSSRTCPFFASPLDQSSRTKRASFPTPSSRPVKPPTCLLLSVPPCSDYARPPFSGLAKSSQAVSTYRVQPFRPCLTRPVPPRLIYPLATPPSDSSRTLPMPTDLHESPARHFGLPLIRTSHLDSPGQIQVVSTPARPTTHGGPKTAPSPIGSTRLR